MVLMQVLVLFLAVDRHADVQAGDAALLVLRAGDLSPAAEQGVHALHIALGLGQQGQQRGHEHVTRRAHIAVQIQQLHLFVSRHLPRWFIMLTI